MNEEIINKEELYRKVFGPDLIRVNRISSYQYLNGNYIVMGNISLAFLEKRGLVSGEPLRASFPDSIDLKISNRCFWGCPFCHENSTPKGKLFNLERTKDILKQLPNLPIEIAIGGGNILESPEETTELLKWIYTDTLFLPRITITQEDLIKYRRLERGKTKELQEFILSLPDGVGVSLKNLPKEVKIDDKSYFPDPIISHTPLDTSRDFDKVTVYHIIAGIFPIEDLKILLYGRQGISNRCPVLVLGYKQWGRAKDTKLPESIHEFEKVIKEYIALNPCERSTTIAFDNLAIEQLHIKEVISEQGWNNSYMGGEGNHSMYIDAVEETYARTSRSEKRISWNDIKLLDFFKQLQDDKSDF